MIRTALAGLALVVCASAAPPTKCSNTPVQWIVNNLTLDGVSPSLITNDGTPTYVDGQSGVSAVIDCTPNAHISFNTSQRSISYHFTSPLYTDQYTPSGLTGSVVNFSSITVRNILYQHNASSEYTFTTRLDSFSSQFGSFRMLNLSSQAVAPGSGGDDVSNSPYADALVYVHHCPKSNLASGGCPALAHETYYVYPDPTVNGTTSTGLPIAQVGAMVLTVGNGKNAQTVNGGEFSMPFYFAISLLN